MPFIEITKYDGAKYTVNVNFIIRVSLNTGSRIEIEARDAAKYPKGSVRTYERPKGGKGTGQEDAAVGTEPATPAPLSRKGSEASLAYSAPDGSVPVTPARAPKDPAAPAPTPEPETPSRLKQISDAAKRVAGSVAESAKAAADSAKAVAADYRAGTAKSNKNVQYFLMLQKVHFNDGKTIDVLSAEAARISTLLLALP